MGVGRLGKSRPGNFAFAASSFWLAPLLPMTHRVLKGLCLYVVFTIHITYYDGKTLLTLAFAALRGSRIFSNETISE